ncbi:AEC family transporter [Petroclostridium sp. X23]|uniref:AEC family transporter n=1 Tax=Petroclostridium sp. X23 TaxID=3045146 RepID=UPI0024AE5ECE|nr:AEC family transporter [Petroclostridium sp. X23]WHH60684.1 AEC family transporter [Petroclostridium sp. X23]
MDRFVYIFINIIVPVFLQIGIGYAIQKKFNLHIGTLTKSVFFVFLPAMLFTKIYHTEISKEIFFSIIVYSLTLFSILFFISWSITRFKKYEGRFSKAFINSVCFYNGGNFVLPIVQLLYNDPFATAIQVIVIMAQNITSNTIGVFNASSGNQSKLAALTSILKMPMGYAIIAALLLKTMHIQIWDPVWSTLTILGEGMVPLATFTLGAQLANTSISFKAPRVYLSNMIRLIASPIFAYMITLILGIHGVVAQVMIISAAAPTAVATALMAIEFNNEPEFASHAVFSATVFSSVTVTLVIYLVTNFI